MVEMYINMDSVEDLNQELHRHAKLTFSGLERIITLKNGAMIGVGKDENGVRAYSTLILRTNGILIDTSGITWNILNAVAKSICFYNIYSNFGAIEYRRLNAIEKILEIELRDKDEDKHLSYLENEYLNNDENELDFLLNNCKCVNKDNYKTYKEIVEKFLSEDWYLLDWNLELGN